VGAFFGALESIVLRIVVTKTYVICARSIDSWRMLIAWVFCAEDVSREDVNIWADEEDKEDNIIFSKKTVRAVQLHPARLDSHSACLPALFCLLCGCW